MRVVQRKRCAAVGVGIVQLGGAMACDLVVVVRLLAVVLKLTLARAQPMIELAVVANEVIVVMIAVMPAAVIAIVVTVARVTMIVPVAVVPAVVAVAVMVPVTITVMSAVIPVTVVVSVVPPMIVAIMVVVSIVPAAIVAVVVVVTVVIAEAFLPVVVVPVMPPVVLEQLTASGRIEPRSVARVVPARAVVIAEIVVVGPRADVEGVCKGCVVDRERGPVHIGVGIPDGPVHGHRRVGPAAIGQGIVPVARYVDIARGRPGEAGRHPHLVGLEGRPVTRLLGVGAVAERPGRRHEEAARGRWGGSRVCNGDRRRGQEAKLVVSFGGPKAGGPLPAVAGGVPGAGHPFAAGRRDAPGAANPEVVIAIPVPGPVTGQPLDVVSLRPHHRRGLVKRGGWLARNDRRRGLHFLVGPHKSLVQGPILLDSDPGRGLLVVYFYR